MLLLRPLLSLLLALFHTPIQVDPGAVEACFAQGTNAARSVVGAPQLPVSAQLSTEARAHSQEMATANSLYHSNLLQQYPGNQITLGENVGEGPSCETIQQAFINSPHHYENIVNHIWTSFGVGVAVDSGGEIWVTVAFEDAAPPATAGAIPATAAAAAPTPKAPAPATPAPSRRPAAPISAPTPAHPAPAPGPSRPASSPSITATPSTVPTVPAPSATPSAAPETSTAIPSVIAGVTAAVIPVGGSLTSGTTRVAPVAAEVGVAPALCLLVGALWARRRGWR